MAWLLMVGGVALFVVAHVRDPKFLPALLVSIAGIARALLSRLGNRVGHGFDKLARAQWARRQVTRRGNKVRAG